jgi:type III secretion protein R
MPSAMSGNPPRRGSDWRRRTPIWIPAMFLAAPAAAALGDSALSPALNSPVLLLIALAGLTLVPFALIMVTSFVKIAVVLSIVRSALGTQQIPPTQVIIGLAIVLTVHIMVPVGVAVYGESSSILKSAPADLFSASGITALERAAKAGGEPILQFLTRHSHAKERQLFVDLAARMSGSSGHTASERDVSVLVPAFVISELTEAFQIGFLIFVPFLVIDMVVANILMAMGMFMLSPTMISLPFKLLLFVLADGWFLLARGLVLGYA